MVAIPGRRGRSDAQRRAERVTRAISAGLLVGLVALILGIELTQGDSRPRIDAQPHFSRMYENGGAWYLPVTVSNEGHEATDTVRVDLVRPIDGEPPEVAELEFTFLAGNESAKGIAVFDERPTTDSIEVDVQSTTAP